MQWRRSRSWIAAVLMVVATAGTLSSAPNAGAATDPLVGYWRNPNNGGVIQVIAGSPQLNGTGFYATVTVAYPAGNGCTYEVGRFVWQAIARQADGSYTGVLQGFSAGSSSGCPASAQTFTIRLTTIGGLPTLQLCTTASSCTSYLWTPVSAPTTTVKPVTTTTLATTTTTSRFGTTTTSTFRPGTTTSTTRPTVTVSTTTTTIKRVAAPGDFPQGYWLVHDTGHATLNGPVKDDVYVLIGFAPDPDGHYKLADGSGGYFHYSSDFNTGPLYNKAQVCAAAAARGLPPQSWYISYYHIDFDCRPAATTTTKPRPLPTAARPKSTTSTTLAVRKDLVVTSSLPPRMGTAAQPDGATTPEQVKPASWPVDLQVRVGRTTTCLPGSYSFAIRGRPVAVAHLPEQSDPCTFRWLAPEQGTFDVKVGTMARDGVHTGAGTATVRDMLIVGLGDSNGSGEGNPPWANARCHRSANSFESLAARQLQTRDRTVTFVHLACSGASINKGMVRPYPGIEEPAAGELPLPSQISDMEARVAGRTVDAVIISIGINDYGFGPIVGFCVDQDECQERPYPVPTSEQTLEEYTDAITKDLPNRYAELASRLTRAKIDPRRVYITQYFDPTWNARGKNFCNPLIHTPKGDFDQAEARWASQRLLAPLNAAVAAAAEKHHWNAVKGAQLRFRTHGYCVADADRWIVQLLESASAQWDKNGTLHANLRGNQDNANAVVAAIRPTKK